MELISKKYRVLKSLGQGAMGEVYLVLPPRGEPVALKLLKTSESGESHLHIEQFQNEFKVLNKLSHPNIGKIFDYGYDEELKRVFFTLPWLKGNDLFFATKDLSFDQCENYFVQVLRALNYLHQKGIIHCDLKPGNIFVENSQVLLIDFGLAGYLGESIVGTPTYLAPEIYRGQPHSVLTDLYAVGVIFYNCLTRTQPFGGASLQEVYDRHRTHTPPPVSQINPQVPKYFSDIITTLLAKKPEERYSSASTVIEEIAAFSKNKYSVETAETLLSYLPATSEVIGRQGIQLRIENLVKSFINQKEGGTYFGIFIYGAQGLGKTNFVGQIKSRLQLEKMIVEEACLPLSDAERHVLWRAQTILLEDVDNYLADAEGLNNLKAFRSFLEQKILSPETGCFLLVVSGTKEESWKLFEGLFPSESLQFEKVALTPFTIDETRVFLESIMGQKEVPESYVKELYRNTEGNPGICTQLVQNLIQQGLLFDSSGRWSVDLLPHLEEVLKKVEVPRSLEEKIALEYAAYSPEEKEIVIWLGLASPHGLGIKALERLTGFGRIKKTLSDMETRRIVRLEEKKRYVLYRSAQARLIRKIIPLSDQQNRHLRLTEKELGLDQPTVWLHQSQGGDPAMAQQALERLAEFMIAEGKKEEALEFYQQLNEVFVKAPLITRFNWAVKTSELLIWLNRFAEVDHLLSSIEKEIEGSEQAIPIKNRLILWEKRGLSLLHQEQMEEANRYFLKGLSQAGQNPETRVEEIRFLNDLAEIELITGHPEKAIAKFSESREKARRLTRAELSLITNNDLGHVYHRLKEYSKAIPLLKEDIKIFSKIKNSEPLVRALYTLAEGYSALKKFRRAVNKYKRCIVICKKDHIFPVLLRAYNGLGNVYQARKKNKEALLTYQKAIEISLYLKDPITRAALLANQGLMYRNEHNWALASRRFLLAKQLLEEKEKKLPYEQMLLSKCYNELAHLAREQKDNLKALSFQVELVQLVDKSDTLQAEKFEVKYELAELYLENRLGDPFLSEIKSLDLLAKSKDEMEKVSALKERWKKIQRFDQESTQKLAAR